MSDFFANKNIRYLPENKKTKYYSKYDRKRNIEYDEEREILTDTDDLFSRIDAPTVSVDNLKYLKKREEIEIKKPKVKAKNTIETKEGLDFEEAGLRKTTKETILDRTKLSQEIKTTKSFYPDNLTPTQYGEGKKEVVKRTNDIFDLNLKQTPQDLKEDFRFLDTYPENIKLSSGGTIYEDKREVFINKGDFLVYDKDGRPSILRNEKDGSEQELKNKTAFFLYNLMPYILANTISKGASNLNAMSSGDMGAAALRVATDVFTALETAKYYTPADLIRISGLSFISLSSGFMDRGISIKQFKKITPFSDVRITTQLENKINLEDYRGDEVKTRNSIEFEPSLNLKEGFVAVSKLKSDNEISFENLLNKNNYQPEDLRSFLVGGTPAYSKKTYSSYEMNSFSGDNGVLEFDGWKDKLNSKKDKNKEPSTLFNDSSVDMSSQRNNNRSGFKFNTGSSSVDIDLFSARSKYRTYELDTLVSRIEDLESLDTEFDRKEPGKLLDDGINEVSKYRKNNVGGYSKGDTPSSLTPIVLGISQLRNETFNILKGANQKIDELDGFRNKGSLYSLGYISVLPFNSSFNKFDIPLQFNPTISEGSSTANYQATNFLARTGDLQTYVNTSALSGVSFSTNYVVTTGPEENKETLPDEKYNINYGWEKYYTHEFLKAIEKMYRSLVYPAFTRNTDNESGKMSFDYSKPPIIRIVVGGNGSNILTYPKKFLSAGEKETDGSYFRNFVVSSVSIEKNTNENAFISTRDGRGLDSMGFTVSLNLIEVTRNYMDILPDFKDYYDSFNNFIQGVPLNSSYDKEFNLVNGEDFKETLYNENRVRNTHRAIKKKQENEPRKKEKRPVENDSKGDAVPSSSFRVMEE